MPIRSDSRWLTYLVLVSALRQQGDMTYVAASGTARIQHADTGEVFEIDSDELDFEAIGADERNMGPEIHHQAELEHPELGTLTWGL